MNQRVVYERWTQRPVKAVQEYKIIRNPGRRPEVEFRHTVEIDGQVLTSAFRADQMDFDRGHIPIDYIDREVRNHMMDGLEKHIYGDVI